MMLVLLGAAAALVAVPGVTDRVGRRLDPREWAWLSALALGGGLALLEVALVLRAAPPALRTAGVGQLASACERLLGPLLAGGPTMGWAAGAAAVALPGSAVIVWRRGCRVRGRLAAELWLGRHRTIAGHSVIVLPAARPLAMSFEQGKGAGFIVVSDGLLAALDETRTEAVVRHEAAHLQHRHQRLLTLATLADHILGWAPPVAASAAALHLAVERWADEEAAGPEPARRRAVRDTLLALAAISPVAGVAGFANAQTVAARIVALESPPLPPALGQHVLLYVPGSVAGLVAAPALVSWGGHVHMVMTMSGRCSF